MHYARIQAPDGLETVWTADDSCLVLV